MPEVKLVWPCARSSDATIAKLLSAVNEVVPLEGSDWGLEDYVVELTDGQGGSYECLHFQPVAQTLKDEDQVMYVCDSLFIPMAPSADLPFPCNSNDPN